MNRDCIKRANDNYELRDEYDLSQMQVMPKGRYAPERRAGRNIVVLEPDVTPNLGSESDSGKGGEVEEPVGWARYFGLPNLF
jgi:hypothetical protein